MMSAIFCNHYTSEQFIPQWFYDYSNCGSAKHGTIRVIIKKGIIRWGRYIMIFILISVCFLMIPYRFFRPKSCLFYKLSIISLTWSAQSPNGIHAFDNRIRHASSGVSSGCARKSWASLNISRSSAVAGRLSLAPCRQFASIASSSISFWKIPAISSVEGLCHAARKMHFAISFVRKGSHIYIKNNSINPCLCNAEKNHLCLDISSTQESLQSIFYSSFAALICPTSPTEIFTSAFSPSPSRLFEYTA